MLMKVELEDGSVFFIQFGHGFVPNMDSPGDFSFKREGRAFGSTQKTDKMDKSSNVFSLRATQCGILVPYDGKEENHSKFDVLGGGVSICSEKDNFTRETGRKVALQKALLNCAGFTKAIRRKFWEAYRNRAVQPEVA